MNSFRLPWFVVVLLFFTVQSKKICDFLDAECMTRGANRMFSHLTGGIDGIADSSDPMYQEKVEGEFGALKYELTNVTFKGMGDCKVIRLICNPKELTFEYFLRCPHLELKSTYNTEGALRSFLIDGKGVFTFTADDYIVKYKGFYGKLISEEDQTPRVFIKTFDIETEPKGKSLCEINKRYSGDKSQSEQAVAFLNENPVEMDKIFRNAVVDSFFIKFMRNLSNALKTFHLDELVPKEED